MTAEPDQAGGPPAADRTADEDAEQSGVDVGGDAPRLGTTVAELLVSVCLVVVATVVGTEAFAFPGDAGLWPLLASGLLGCMAVWSLIRSGVAVVAGMRRRGVGDRTNDAPDEVTGDGPDRTPLWLRTLALILLLVAYAFLQRWIGFIASGVVLVLGSGVIAWSQRRTFAPKDLVPVVGLVVFTVAAYFLFTRVLYVRVP